jgi:serine/threonine-protein kinase
MPPVTAGETFPISFGRYTLERLIARGGMAEIFLAKTRGSHGFERSLVIKRILPEHAREARFVDWFIDEARLMARLEHPKVVQVYDFGEVDGSYFLAMEHVKGLDCLELLRLCALRRWRPSPIVAAQIMADVLDALWYAHNLKDEAGRPLNIVHCDVTPSNIFVSDLGEVKLSDFGIATMGVRRGRSETGFVRGKYGYLAPEVITGQPVDHRSDIFSAGVVLCELLMVQRLFRGKNYLDVLLQARDGRLDRLDKYGQHIPPELREILDFALARDPYLRFQDAGDFRDALHHFLLDRRELVRGTSLRRFMQRLRDPETPPGAASPHVRAMPERPYPPLAAAFQHGRRRILLGPPRPVGPPGSDPPSEEHTEQPPEAREAEPVLAGLPSDSPSQEVGEGFASGESLPSAPSLRATLERPLGETRPRQGLAPGFPLPSDCDTLPRLVSSGQWDLRDRSLVGILFRLALDTETGLLVLRDSSLVKEIYLVDGDPQFVSSNSPDELFGQFLIAQGVFSEAELGRALAILPDYQGRLGEALVALGLLRPMQMLRLLTSQVRQKILNAFRITDGQASFYRGLGCPRPAAPLGLDAFELLAAGVEALEWLAIQERLARGMDLKPRASSPPPVPPEVFRVGDYPRVVYDRLDGQRSLVEHLLSAPPEPRPGAFMRMVYLLTECGLVVLE